MRNLASKIETNSIIAYKNLDQLNSSISSSNSNLLNQSLNNNQNNNTNGSTHSVNSSGNFSSSGKDQPCYEFVEPTTTGLTPRPIIILGHLRDRINDRLNEIRGDKFASVVPRK